MEMARRKKVDVVLFWALDRFSREGARKTIEYLGVLDDAGVLWHSYTEPFISSMGVFREAIIAIMGALAKQERVRISERTKAGLDRVRAAGVRLGRPDRDEGRVEQARALRASGKSYGEVAAEMGVTKAWAWKMCKGE
jgi:DNA invertase Pin-like site-specific DNA recombinase